QGTFKDAKPEFQAFANDAAAAMQANDNPKAFMQLNALASNPALTEQQRQAASASMMAVGQKLREAAAKGDADAAKALEMYRSSK
ncbi:MAG TPA: hypothetical protein VHH73_01075, partial [Verrucomicrobiae bacterium]|nr:hypothetical protein [Verrucomicrobiae bacterium]